MLEIQNVRHWIKSAAGTPCPMSHMQVSAASIRCPCGAIVPPLGQVVDLQTSQAQCEARKPVFSECSRVGGQIVDVLHERTLAASIGCTRAVPSVMAHDHGRESGDCVGALWGQSAGGNCGVGPCFHDSSVV